MKFSELFTLNPIETVIEIEKADKQDEARRLVERFIITPSLASAIENIALPQLRFDGGAEGKGVLVVGNYGTGKSHVMSFLSILAENETYLSSVQGAEWRDKLAPMAGKYKVKRCQIAASLRNLYEIVAEELTELAKRCGFPFAFKDLRSVTNVKHEFARFMEAFETAPLSASQLEGMSLYDLRLARNWPWAGQLAAAFARLQALPAPSG